jgi:hypothetical protein
MNKKASYRGQLFEVIDQDEIYVTLEGWGYKKRVLKDDILFEEEPEDDLPEEYPDREIVTDAPEDTLPNEIPDRSLKLDEMDVLSQVDPATAQKIAQKQSQKSQLRDKEAKIDQEIAQMTKIGMKKKEAEQKKLDKQNKGPGMISKAGSAIKSGIKSVGQAIGLAEEQGDEDMEKRTTMDGDEWDKYKEQGVDVDPESHAETQETNDDRMKLALQGLRRTFRQKLNELDDLLEMAEEDEEILAEDGAVEEDEVPENAEIHVDPDRPSDDVNYRSTDNYYDNLDAEEDTDFEQVNEEDHDEEEDDAEQLDEEGAGTASVAGPGVADATVNQAINGQQGVAVYPGRMGIGMQRRKIDETFFKLSDDEVVLKEAHVPTINRHRVADKVEEQLDPMTESDCTGVQRRKARMESIGRYATLRECAMFIAENRYACGEGYVPREKKLEAATVLEMMKKKNSKLMREIRKA